MSASGLTPGLEIDLVEGSGEPVLAGTIEYTRRGHRLSQGLREVAADPNNLADDVVQYWTVVEVNDGRDPSLREAPLAYSLTYLSDRPMGWERAKTHGHVHTPGRTDRPDPEVYEVLRGKAIFLFQDLRVGPRATVVYAVHAEVGETVVIPPYMYHASVNGGDGPLVFGDVCSRGLADDYGLVKESHGFAYHFPRSGWAAVANAHYASVPALREVGAAEWSPQDVGSLYARLRDDAPSLSWLLDAAEFSRRYPEFDRYEFT